MKKFLFVLIFMFLFIVPSISSAQSFGVQRALSAAVAQPQPEAVDGYLQHFGIGLGPHTGLPDFLGFSVMVNFNKSLALVGTFGFLQSVVLEYRFPTDESRMLGVFAGVALLDTYNRNFNSNVNSSFGFELGVVVETWGPGGKDRIPVIVAGAPRISISLVVNAEEAVLHLIFGFMMGVFFE
jgi:hypothetical protein